MRQRNVSTDRQNCMKNYTFGKGYIVIAHISLLNRNFQTLPVKCEERINECSLSV